MSASFSAGWPPIEKFPRFSIPHWIVKVGIGALERLDRPVELGVDHVGVAVEVAQRVADVAAAAATSSVCGSGSDSMNWTSASARMSARSAALRPGSRCTMICVEVSAAAACGSRTRRARASGSVRISTEVFSATAIVNLNGSVRE